MNNKEKFYNLSKDFFDAGIIREIYNSDNISICNICNATYVVFDYNLLKNLDYPIGFLFNQNGIKDVINNYEGYLALIASFDKADYKRSSIELSPDKFEKYLNLKNKMDIEGPGKDINYDFEEEIMKKYGNGRSR